jgi:ribosomal protein S18 acetylase RimI-like enzyme
MAFDPAAITLRACTVADGEFAFETVVATMKDYAIATWGEWREDHARADTVVGAHRDCSQVIELNGTRIGLLRVTRHAGHHQLEQLYLVPAQQNRGIGEHLLSAVVAEAHGEGKSVRLRVLKVNPAQAFYARHGFVVVQDMPERVAMELAPPTARAG